MPGCGRAFALIYDAFASVGNCFGTFGASQYEEAKSEKEEGGYGTASSGANARPSVLGRLAKYSPPHAEEQEAGAVH